MLNKLFAKFKIFSNNLFYIGGNDALPPPLTKDEEYELVNKLDTGDKRVRATLIERNLRLVVYIARKFENTGVNVEDLISVGTIGLIKAVNTFDPEKQIKLATYASRCIENEILMYLRRNSKIKTEISLYEPLNVDWDGNELLLSDIIGTDNDVVYNIIEEDVDKQLLWLCYATFKCKGKRDCSIKIWFKWNYRKNTKGSGRYTWNIAILYIKT